MAHSLGIPSVTGGESRGGLCARYAWLALITVMTLAMVPGILRAQFTEWDSFSVTAPFSVTAAVRGTATTAQTPEGPVPQVILEAIVGSSAGGNHFDYHGSMIINAPEPNGPGMRVIDTRNPLTFTDFGVQSAFDGLCCSNNGVGYEDNRSVYGVTLFGATPVSFDIEIGTPQFMSELEQRPWFPEGDDDIDECKSCIDDCLDDDDCTEDDCIKLCDCDDDVEVHEEDDPANEDCDGSMSSPAGPGTTYTLRASIGDCRNLDESQFGYHHWLTRLDDLREFYTSCVTEGGEFAIKRIAASDWSVSEVVLDTNIPLTSPGFFTYLHTEACAVGNGYVIGSVLPLVGAGTTTFYATLLDSSGVVQGTSSVVLPGARQNKQVFFCRENENIATFVYHGSGEVQNETDTFIIEVTQAATTSSFEGNDSMLVKRVTEERETSWADSFPTRIVDQSGPGVQFIGLRFEGLEPIAEVDMDFDGTGSASEVRYGGIVVPIMFDTMESADFRHWTSVVEN